MWAPVAFKILTCSRLASRSSPTGQLRVRWRSFRKLARSHSETNWSSVSRHRRIYMTSEARPLHSWRGYLSTDRSSMIELMKARRVKEASVAAALASFSSALTRRTTYNIWLRTRTSWAPASIRTATTIHLEVLTTGSKEPLARCLTFYPPKKVPPPVICTSTHSQINPSCSSAPLSHLSDSQSSTPTNRACLLSKAVRCVATNAKTSCRRDQRTMMNTIGKSTT